MRLLQLMNKPKLLIFIVAYNAEKTISNVLSRIQFEIVEYYNVTILIIDDASKDKTYNVSTKFAKETEFPFEIVILKNPINQGYGGNQKIGFYYAIKNKFEIVALLHGDGQYAPECLHELCSPIKDKSADVVFGSRMMTKFGAIKGGMPIYKYLGNKILTKLQNMLLGTKLSEFHSGYRVYSVESLNKIPFEHNSNVFHFDTQIIIQLTFAKQRIKELPIPTYYGDEICHVHGIPYAKDVLFTTFIAWLQKFGIFYDKKFDCRTNGDDKYLSKVEFPSTHRETINRIEPKSRILDIGCGSGHIIGVLKEKKCYVSGIDIKKTSSSIVYDEFHQFDLNEGPIKFPIENYDVILLLDVIEHLIDPDRFLLNFRKFSHINYDTKILISVPNTAFISLRLGLLLGMFNYGERGILDKTHKRLFTLASIRNILVQNGYEIINVKGIPAPFALAIRGNNFIAKALTYINIMLIKIWKRLFSYQFYIEARQKPTLESLLKNAKKVSNI